MSYSLKIDGDFSGVKKGILEISKEMKGLSKKQQTSIFSKEDQAMLSRQTMDISKQLQKESEKLTRNAERYRKVVKSTTASEKARLKASQKLLETKKKLLTVEKQDAKLKDVTGTLKGPGRMSQMKTGMGRGVSRMPGMGMMRGLGGLGLMGGLGMLGGAALGFGAYKGYQGYQQFKGGSKQRLMMKGRGIENATGINEPLAKLGYTPEEIREQQVKGAAAFGKGGGTQGGVLQRAQFERSRGLEKGAMMEAGQGLRGAMGGKAAQEAMYKIQATILGKNIKENIGPFLETSAAMLTQMNEQGLPADTEILALFGSMVKSGTSEKRAMGQIMSVNQAVAGSQGDQNALFQSLFASAGIGGGTMGGAALGVKQGLFGSDPEKLKAMGMTPDQIKQFKNLKLTGEEGGFEARAGKLVEFADTQFGKSDEELVRKESVMSKLLGTKTPGEAVGFIEKLRGAKGDKAKIDEIKKQIKDAAKSPEMKIQEDIKKGIEELKGIDSRIEANHGMSLKELETLGQSAAPVGLAISETLTSIDGAIAHMASLVGYSPEEEKKEKEQNKKEGFERLKLSEAGFGKLPQKEQEIQIAKAKGALNKTEGNIKELESQGWFKKFISGGIINQQEEKKEELGLALKRMVELQEANLKANQKTANETSKRKGGKTKPSSTTGKN